ncbi:MAG: GNAT family N-acetyltransferase [Pseudoflavonifractor sp.]|nr:GNAT family N-acetyltransferase [Pseudoflavonifractor sp.]
MSDTQFRLLTEEELKILYETHMKRDFPEDELKPLSRLLALMGQGEYEPYGLFLGESLLAYALYWKAGEDPYVMLDYFAVLPEGRNQGTGSALLRQMLDRFCQGGRGVFGEVEIPNTGDEKVDALRRRRLGFYDRAGLRKINYYTKVFGVPYIILAYGPDIPDDVLMDTYRKLYHNAFPDPKMYEKNVFITEAVKE